MAKKDKKGGSGSRLKKKAVAQQLVDLFNEFPEKEYDVKDLFAHFKASNHPAKMIVMDALNDLVLDDYVTSDGQGHYRNAVRSNVMEGTFVRKRNGRNSFVPDDGGKSILVCERNSLHALDGDRVRVTMLARRAGHTREAEVTEILERANDTFVGQLQVERGYGFLVTESRSLANDIFIPKDKLNGGQNGDKAVVKIIEWPSDSKSPIGKVVDILGKQGENNAEMHAILAQYGLPYTYPEKVEKAAEKLSPDITPEEIARREDFREVTTFTIDPHDAKDFDDALSIRQLQKGLWEVGVHIADVSHYVKEVLPWAKLAKLTIIETVEVLDQLPDKRSRDAHIKEVERGLKAQYGPALKKLTRSQGRLLIKLVNRECNQTGYAIAKAFIGPFKANLYQGIAVLFGNSLNKKYDPDGDDRYTERVVRMVEAGLI